MLLQNQHYSINEIARIVGYDNPLYFSRIFQKRKVSPLLSIEKCINQKKQRCAILCFLQLLSIYFFILARNTLFLIL